MKEVCSTLLRLDQWVSFLRKQESRSLEAMDSASGLH